jgi:hypothetical protein
MNRKVKGGLIFLGAVFCAVGFGLLVGLILPENVAVAVSVLGGTIIGFIGMGLAFDA